MNLILVAGAKAKEAETPPASSLFSGYCSRKRARSDKRGGKVYACMVKDTKSDSLMPIIKERIQLDSIVYSDSYRSYNALDVSGFHHFRINHQTDFAIGRNHINGIENFWSQAKRILRKYNGIPKESFSLFLSEYQFRFNYGDVAQQLKILRE